jgi:hypothetical protein
MTWAEGLKSRSKISTAGRHQPTKFVQSPSYLIRKSLRVGAGTGGQACAGGAGRGDGGGVVGRGAGATVAGAELGTGAGAGASTCLPARSCRIGTLSFMWACPTYRSNSSLLAWRRIACWSASGSLLKRNTSDGVLVMRAIPDGV